MCSSDLCVACGRVGKASQMVRISGARDGDLEVNANGGRGAWMCCGGEEIVVALMTATLSRALRREIRSEAVERLQEVMRERRMAERRGR